MTAWREKARTRVQESIVLLPIVFVLLGVVIAAALLQVDAALSDDLFPARARWTPGGARFLYSTLVGAMLTFAGLTFLVRSTIVSLAASTYSARVVVGFLEDRFQQSMMSLMLGLFAYTVTVLQAIPDPDPQVTDAAVPQLSVLVGILATIGALMVVMVAIRSAVRSMYAGALARTTTDLTIDRIRTAFELATGDPPAGASASIQPPARRGRHVRAPRRGWVQAIDEQAILAALPPGATTQLEVRVGLYVIEGRPVATVWTDEPVDVEAVADAVTLGRTRIYASDVNTSLQTLVDIAVGSLETGAADVAATYEVVQHIEMVLRELARREIPDRVHHGTDGRTLIRDRAWSFEDYVRVAFDRLRRVGAPYPTVTAALLHSAGELALELDDEGMHQRAALLREQLDRVLASAAAADLIEGDLADLRAIADRYRDGQRPHR